MRVDRLGPIRRSEGGGVEAIALPLGMSFAAVVAQVTSTSNSFKVILWFLFGYFIGDLKVESLGQFRVLGS